MYGNTGDFDSFTGQSTLANQQVLPIEWFNSLVSLGG